MLFESERPFMSEFSSPSLTLTQEIKAIPLASPSQAEKYASDSETLARIAELEREAKVHADPVQVGILFHEMGLLWEHRLRHQRNAAISYQSAFKAAPKYLANIRDARRLFAAVGNWTMVLQLLEAEIAASSQNNLKAALLFERAQILGGKLGRPDEAAAVFRQCLALEPSDVSLLVMLESHFADGADPRSLVQVYQLLAKHSVEVSVQASFLTSAGLLLEDKLGLTDEAAVAYRKAFAIDRRDPQLLAAIKRLARRDKQVDEELAALAAEAELLGSDAGPAFLQISKTYERLQRNEDAVAALNAALAVAPKDALVLAELARMHDQLSQHEALAHVLSLWIATEPEPSEAIDLHLRLAQLADETLGKTELAITHYRAALSLDAAHSGALSGLGRLYARTRDWPHLVEIYLLEAGVTLDPKHRAGRLYKAAETLEERLQQTEQAIAKHAEALEAVPGFLPSHKALERLFEKLADWPKLVALYEQDLTRGNKEQQVNLLLRIAALVDEKLGDLPRATAFLQRAFELSPDNVSTLRQLGRIYERTSQWPLLLEVLEREARLSPDTTQVLRLGHRRAEILEDDLKQRPQAIEAWQQVLRLAPNYLPALRALGRLYADEQQWDALNAMYRTEADIAESPEQAAALIQKIGEIYEHKLSQVNDAIAAYCEVLTLSPTHFPALTALGRLYRRQGAWENLIEVLRAEGANRSDPTDRANALFHAATIWDEQLNLPDKAIECYQEVLAVAPAHSNAFVQLERLLSQKADTAGLVTLLDQQAQIGPPSSRIAALVRLARIYANTLGDKERATRCCQQALSIEPDNITALRLFDSVCPDKILRAEARARLAEAVVDYRVSTAMRMTLIDAPPRQDLAALRALLSKNPGDEMLGQTVEKLLLHTEDLAGVASVLEERAKHATDAAERQQLALRIADIYEHSLQRLDKAGTTYAEAVAHWPNSMAALFGYRNILRKQSDWPRLQMALDKIAEAGRAPDTSISALIESAQLSSTQLNDLEGAETRLQRALAIESTHAEASRRLEDVLERQGKHQALIELLSTRAAFHQGQNDRASAAEAYFRAARIELQARHNRDAAIALLDNALMCRPTLADALEMKGRLAFESQSYAESAAAYAVRVQQGGDPHTVASFHLQLGILFHEHLQDAARAANHFSSVLNVFPQHVEALEHLSRIHLNSKNYAGASDCLHKLIDSNPEKPQRARYLAELAQLNETGLGDVQVAMALYTESLTTVPNDSGVFQRANDLAERTGQTESLRRLLEIQIANSAHVTEVTRLQLRLARLNHHQLKDTSASIAAYQSVIASEPTNVEAHAALAAIYESSPSTQAAAIDAYRKAIAADPSQVANVRNLRRLFQNTGNTDGAFVSAGVLVFLQAATGEEQSFYQEQKLKLPADFRGGFGPADFIALTHPSIRHPLLDVFAAVGDQFAKFSPPQFETHGVDRRADRLKPDTAVARAFDIVARLFAVAPYEVYQSKRGMVTVETSDPFSVLVSQDAVRKLNLREQRFFFGQAAFTLAKKCAIASKLTVRELGDVLGNAIRISVPEFGHFGKRSEEQSKQLRKLFSRKALRQLEEAARAVASSQSALSIEQLLSGLQASQDRTGITMAGDVAAALSVLLKEDGPPGSPRPESPEGTLRAVAQRNDVRALIEFALSDDFLRLRQKLGVAVP
jgi:cellulose synthase operon protein C